MITIGLMSGTSLDGVDAVACEIKKSGATVSIKFLAHEKVSYTPSLRANLLAVSEGGGGASEICKLNAKVGKTFARAAKKVIGSKPLAKKKIDIIGSHGQTIWHEQKNGRHCKLVIHPLLPLKMELLSGPILEALIWRGVVKALH